MLLPRQFHLDAFDQPTADTIQRPTYIWLQPLQSVRNLNRAKLFDVTQLKQFVIRSDKLLSAATQGDQMRFRPIIVELGSAVDENIQQFLSDTIGRTPTPYEIADFVSCCLACPGKEIVARSYTGPMKLDHDFRVKVV